ncbi:hypothetical protein R6Q59_012689 [Mikania micrantha]
MLMLNDQMKMESTVNMMNKGCRKKIPYYKLSKDVDQKLYNAIWEYTKESRNIHDDRAKDVTLKKEKSLYEKLSIQA